jgi:enterobacterial common antigen flippase
VALGGIQALTMGAGLLRTKILALLLGPEGLGIAGVIDQTVALVTHLGALSFPFAALAYLSRHQGERFTRLFRAFFRVLLGASLLATAIAIGIALWNTALIDDALVAYRVALIVGLAGAPGLAAASYLRNVLAATGRQYHAALVALVSGLALIATSYAGVTLWGLTGLYTGNLLVALATVPLVWWYLRRSGAVGPERAGPASESAFRVLREQDGLLPFVTTIHVLSLVSPLAYLVARVAILSHHGAMEAGFFYAAAGLAIAIRVVLSHAQVLYLTPLLNRPIPKPERAAAAAEYLRVLTVLVVIGAGAVVLFPREWVFLLYSPQFAAAAGFLAAFVLAEVVLLFAGVFQALLIGFDDYRAHALIAVVGQVLLAVLALVWAPALGSLGVALAFLVGHAAILGLLVVRVRLRHASAGMMAPLRPLILGIALLAAGGWWAAAGAAPPLAARLAAYLIVSALALMLLGPDDRRWLLRPLRRTRSS